jgi:hypothetical protein
VAGSHAIPAPAEMRADDARYDNPLSGALLHAESPPVVSLRAGNMEIIRGAGQARRRQHGAWVVPGVASSFRISRAFPHGLAKARIPLNAGQRLAPKASGNVGGAAGLAGVGNLSLAFPPRDGRRACDEGGNKR